MSSSDYFDLKQLQAHRGYQKLQALWAHEYAEVMKGLHTTASRNNETAWRYKAGILRGFDLAIGQLERAMLQMEKEGETETPASATVEELMKEIRGETK
jgi:hypothetical protein